MTTSYFRAACCALALSAALPTAASAAGELVISCFRGPWTQVIWDAPNTSFTDSLVGMGYDVATATAIGTRVCRDQEAVGNPDLMKALTLRLIAETPKREPMKG